MMMLRKWKAYSGRALIVVFLLISLGLGAVAFRVATVVVGWDNFWTLLFEGSVGAEKIMVTSVDKAAAAPAGETTGTPPDESAGSVRDLTAPERIALAGPFLALVSVSLAMAGLVLTAYYNYKSAWRSRETALLGSASSQIALIKSRLDTVLRSTQVEFGKQGLYPGAKENMIDHFGELLKDHEEELRKRVGEDIELLFDLEKLIADRYARIIETKGL
jgi:hypothetical protein